MTTLNRLSQRLKENFVETTRDLSLLSGTATNSSSTYFDTSDDKLKEISKLLESRVDRERLEGMKRIIAGMSKGRDMERFFAQVVKNVVSPSIEIRKLVYIYLLRFASTNSDLLLLSINTFQKDLSDPSPLIRSMSLRVLTSIRVPVIQGIVMLGLKKLVTDRNPWVRKTVAGGLAKVYEMDTSSLSQIIPLLQTLLSSQSPLTLGATLTAFLEICPDRLDFLHPYYRHICRLLVDADEWGQVVALQVLTRYARAMLEKPDTAGPINTLLIPPRTTTTNGTKNTETDESEDEFAGLDEDLAMLLHCIKPLFQSRNPAVVLATSNVYYHLAPAGHKVVGQELLVRPLLRLAGSSGNEKNERGEIAVLTWEVLAEMVEERPWLFTSYHSSFFLFATDALGVQIAKLRALSALVTSENAQVSMREFKYYVRFPNDEVSEEAVRAIGHCVRTQAEVASTGLSTLMRLLKSKRDTLVARAVIVLKSVILSQTQANTLSNASLPLPQRLVARLAKGLDGITNPKARASVFWLVGQFAASDLSDESSTRGLGWEGVALWVPDVVRKGIKGFVEESGIAKLQILTLVTKLLVLSPSAPQLTLMSQYLFNLARYDSDYDVRDRARFLHALLRGVRGDKSAVGENGGGKTLSVDEDAETEKEMGGVILRREQIKVIILGKRDVKDVGTDGRIGGQNAEYEVGSMSRIAGKKLGGYEELPEWTDDPTDSSLRESELDDPSRLTTPHPSHTPTNYAPPPPLAVPTHVSSASSSAPTPRNNAASSMDNSPAGSVPQNVKSKFQDLDRFLDSDSEEEESEDESESDGAPIRPVTAPPRSAIVPEYDETTSESEDAGTDQEEEDESSEEESENARFLSR
ncbi:hypothetical protein IAR55_002420 [Kwoniella newhampshirensis]|uniref:Clathrin/coatomer adaptor adaptin-like N-terminal domain-containing protein n=1 Tax=Kwoniella newhampshirensis TaxID=1651941 RepID=A0AAW0YU72_9TREE